MSPISISDLHRIFNKLDENRDGLLSLDELMGFLQKTGFHTRNEDLEELLAGKQCLDPIDFCFFHEAIIRGMEGNNVVEKDLLEAFGVFDLNGDGVISSEELQSALCKMGLWDQRCGKKDCKKMIKEFDANCDGVLDFEEFKSMMLVSKS